jgi:hypothetical protein
MLFRLDASVAGARAVHVVLARAASLPCSRVAEVGAEPFARAMAKMVLGLPPQALAEFSA